MAWTTPSTAVAGETALTAALWNEQVRDNLSSLVEAGTVLPASPVDGQSFYYVADATNGVVWHLRYRSASPSPYKWEFVGGGVLYTRDTATRNTSSTTYQTTGSPTITLPRSGDYEIVFGAEFMGTAVNGANSFYLGLHVNGAPVAELNSQYQVAGTSAPASYTYRHNGATASFVADVRYRSASAASSLFHKMFLSIRPVRLI